jgi:hypothetical protein
MTKASSGSSSPRIRSFRPSTSSDGWDRTVVMIRSIGSSSRFVGTYSVASVRSATVASRSVPVRGATMVGTSGTMAWTRWRTVCISPGQSSSRTTALGEPVASVVTVADSAVPTDRRSPLPAEFVLSPARSPSVASPTSPSLFVSAVSSSDSRSAVTGTVRTSCSVAFSSRVCRSVSRSRPSVTTMIGLDRCVAFIPESL